MSLNWESQEAKDWQHAAEYHCLRATEAEEKLTILTGKYIDLFHENEGLVASLDRMIGSLMAMEEVCRERVNEAIKERNERHSVSGT